MKRDNTLLLNNKEYIKLKDTKEIRLIKEQNIMASKSKLPNELKGYKNGKSK